MPCGFQPAGHWGFPRHRVATSAHSHVWSAQEPVVLFPSVMGVNFSAPHYRPRCRRHLTPALAGDWAAAGEKDKARRAE